MTQAGSGKFLQNRVGNGIIYSSDYLDDEKALERLLANIDTEPRTKPNFIKFVRECGRNNGTRIVLRLVYLAAFWNRWNQQVSI